MKIGVETFLTEYGIRPEDLGKALEERGFESVWVPEHTHVPAGRQGVQKDGPNLPKEYYHTLDPFVALTAVAAVTSKLVLGTGICLLVERDPILTAKTIASVDYLSGGRVVLGIGGGWNPVEMAHHGTAFETRWELLRERVLAMRAIWTDDPAEFHGKFVEFGPVYSKPKPVGPVPVLLGAHGKKARERAAEYCDGWLPLQFDLATLPGELEDLFAQAAANGRPRPSVTILGYLTPLSPEAVPELEKLGVERVVLNLATMSRDDTLRELDRLAKPYL